MAVRSATADDRDAILAIVRDACSAGGRDPHVEIYRRFGFEPAGSFGITHAPVGAGNPEFQLRRLSRHDGSYTGDFSYCWETKAARRPST